jgi:hypothetical protein
VKSESDGAKFDAGTELVVLLVQSVIEDGDRQARDLLGKCWPDEDWDTEIGKARAEFYVEHGGELTPYIGPYAQLTGGAK